MTITDALLICSPLIILFFILMGEADFGSIWKKPEWSFISILLLIETFRDIGAVAKSQKMDEEQINNGYVFYAIFLVITAIILSMDFRFSIGKSPLNIEAVYVAKFGWFSICLVFFCYKRYKRYSLVPPPSETHETRPV